MLCFVLLASTAVTLTSVSPSISPLAGGRRITVVGTNLGNNNDATLTFNGVSVTTFVSRTATEIVVDSPAAASPGVGNVVVSSPTAGTATLTSAFTYSPTPRTLWFRCCCALSDFIAAG